mmetsp:Transcript_30820/g.55856  ORF Transcript_30820/g.55856 Transcript_30820/m.55856 type:complete len:202 (+) Transcript_30820:444-1049(+)
MSLVTRSGRIPTKLTDWTARYSRRPYPAMQKRLKRMLEAKSMTASLIRCFSLLRSEHQLDFQECQHLLGLSKLEVSSFPVQILHGFNQRLWLRRRPLPLQMQMRSMLLVSIERGRANHRNVRTLVATTLQTRHIPGLRCIQAKVGNLTGVRDLHLSWHGKEGVDRRFFKFRRFCLRLFAYATMFFAEYLATRRHLAIIPHM